MTLLIELGARVGANTIKEWDRRALLLLTRAVCLHQKEVDLLHLLLAQ